MMVRKVIDDDKAAANTFFKETALPLARNLETWIPTEIDNAPAFGYEGRVPQAAIIICWAGDGNYCISVTHGIAEWRCLFCALKQRRMIFHLPPRAKRKEKVIDSFQGMSPEWDRTFHYRG